MDFSRQLMSLGTVLLCILPPTFALTEKVLSTVIFANHGERTPLVWGDGPTLTPLGARQLEKLGSRMRTQYVMPNNDPSAVSLTVRDISSIQLQNDQINILSTADEWVTGSAQAFMQGLYPPLTVGQNYTYIFGESDLANGTNVVAPLGGYQYPNIASASRNDLKSTFVQGTENCPMYTLAMLNYYNSTRFQTIQQQYQPFYDSLKESFLNGVFDDAEIGYFNSYQIWDYLNYAYVHNNTVARKLSVADLARARILANDWMFDMYANSTDDGHVDTNHIHAIAGRTLARYIMNSFTWSIQSKGLNNKINLVFSDYRPMMSFAALAQLMVDRTGEFRNSPAPGASMAFELYVLTDIADDDYPQTTDMYVRFQYLSDTEDATQFQEIPLFGASPSQRMSWSDFVGDMSGIMTSGVGDWCQTCQSSSVFCSFYETGSAPVSSSPSRGGLQPAVAGVIGAIVTLAFVGLVIAAVMLLGGIRFYRRQGKNKSELGGFKGSEKLASDQDLTVPKGGAGATVTEAGPRGHERVGSWELKEPVKTQSLDAGIDPESFGRGRLDPEHDDPNVDHFTVPVRPRDTF